MPTKSFLTKVLSFVFFYFGWGICLERARAGEPYWGPLAVMGMLAFHLWVNPRRSFEMALILSVAIVGTLLDTAYSLLGLIHYHAPYPPLFSWIAPLWVTAIWILFAMCLNHSLKWLYGRWALAALLGASGSVFSYMAGQKVGVINFEAGEILTLSIIACVWAVFFPLSLAYTRWLDVRFAMFENTAVD